MRIKIQQKEKSLKNIFISLSLIGSIMSANAQTNTANELTGNCVDALKAFDEMIEYMYRNPKSPEYNTMSTEELADTRKEAINNVFKKESQEGCKGYIQSFKELTEHVKQKDIKGEAWSTQ